MSGPSAALLRAIDDAKAATDLVELIGGSVRLHRSGRARSGCCPFHSEKTPSFYVWRAHFHCYGCGAHGDVFDWLRHDRGLDLAAAVAYLGGDVDAGDPASREEAEGRRAQRRAERDAKIAAERAEAIREATRWWRRVLPIEGTPGEVYLTRTRGIPRPAGGWPDAVRWLRGNGIVAWHERDQAGEEIRREAATAGAVIVCATSTAGVLQAVQRIYIDAEAQNVRRGDAKRSKVKLSAGAFAPLDDGTGGAVVRLPGPADGPVLHAEGIETALSAWVATGHETRITLGNIDGAQLAPDRSNIICRDDDPPGSAADRRLNDALARWREQWPVLRLAVATPWPERRGDKSDLNDTLKAGGVAAVRSRIGAALDHPPHAMPPASPAMATGGDEPAGVVAPGDSRQAADPRRSETANAAFRLLRRGVPSVELLATLHRLNAQRGDPLPRGVITATTLWAAQRMKEQADAR